MPSSNIEDLNSSKIYCANCKNCILFRKVTSGGGSYFLRIKCSAGMWRKKLGEEKTYKYFTVARRTVDSCDKYDPMDEPKAFLRLLRKNLPVKDETYPFKK